MLKGLVSHEILNMAFTLDYKLNSKNQSIRNAFKYFESISHLEVGKACYVCSVSVLAELLCDQLGVSHCERLVGDRYERGPSESFNSPN